MGATKELFADARAIVEVHPDLLTELNTFYPDDKFEFKRWESKGLKEIYKKDPEWVEANKTLKEAIEYRSEIESRIRVDKQIELYGC